MYVSKKGTKGVHSVTRSQFDDVDSSTEDDSGLSGESEVGEQIEESEAQHLLEDGDHDIDAELTEFALVAEDTANREGTDSDDELLIKRRKIDNEREDSVRHVSSEDASVFDVNIDQ